MRKRFIGLLAAFCALAPAQAALLSYTFNVGAAIPDGSSSGYVNSQDIGPSGIIGDINVRLNFSGGFNGDLYVYLTHGSGFSVLLNRVGRGSGSSVGYGDAGMNVTLDGAASGDIHTYGGNGGALFAPSVSFQPDGRNVSPFTVQTDGARSAFLSSFNGLETGGSWNLFVADVVSGDQSQLVSWGMDIEARRIHQGGQTTALQPFCERKRPVLAWSGKVREPHLFGGAMRHRIKWLGKPVNSP